MSTVRWIGETVCDFCGQECKDRVAFFVDGKTTKGPWGLMCPTDFIFFGIGLGTGKGQKYDAATMFKIEG